MESPGSSLTVENSLDELVANLVDNEARPEHFSDPDLRAAVEAEIKRRILINIRTMIGGLKAPLIAGVLSQVGVSIKTTPMDTVASVLRMAEGELGSRSVADLELIQTAIADRLI